MEVLPDRQGRLTGVVIIQFYIGVFQFFLWTREYLTNVTNSNPNRRLLNHPLIFCSYIKCLRWSALCIELGGIVPRDLKSRLVDLNNLKIYNSDYELSNFLGKRLYLQREVTNTVFVANCFTSDRISVCFNPTLISFVYTVKLLGCTVLQLWITRQLWLHQLYSSYSTTTSLFFTKNKDFFLF